MKEIWKDIKGYEGLYQVSNLGRIKKLPNKILNCTITVQGYKTVHLSKEKQSKIFRVHRLVAKAFIENPNNYDVVNHKDENKLNNCINNLEWCDTKYNIHYSKCWEAANSKTSKKVMQLDANTGEVIRVYNSIGEANRTLGTTHVYDCVKGRCKTVKGYKWEYC